MLCFLRWPYGQVLSTSASAHKKPCGRLATPSADSWATALAKNKEECGKVCACQVLMCLRTLNSG